MATSRKLPKQFLLIALWAANQRLLVSTATDGTRISDGPQSNDSPPSFSQACLDDDDSRCSEAGPLQHNFRGDTESLIQMPIGMNKLVLADSAESTTKEPRDDDEILTKASKALAKADTPAHPDMSIEEEARWHDKIWRIWESLRRAHRHRRRPLQTLAGVREFFKSAFVYEWFIFIVAIAFFVPLQYFLLRKKVPHAASLLIWVVLGLIYNSLVWLRLGTDSGVMWFTGYLLELVFSVENVFVFHVVVRAFRTPAYLTQHALFTVVICQVVFEMVFFMGLAQPLRGAGLLPYFLGAWLVYVGIMAAREDKTGDTTVEETWAFSMCRNLFGERLLHEYNSNDPSWFLMKDGTTYISMLLPATFCLLFVDFLLEVDVTITKIEELPNQYISFTSSAAATFSLSSLFFVAGDLFQKFRYLQYGIAFVLVFFGAQMFLHSVLYIEPLASCGIIVAVIVLCMALSKVFPPSVCQGSNPGEHASEAS